jgi:hypothetical protein
MTNLVALAPSPILSFLDNSGRPNAGGTLLTQVGGVNYPTYQDALGAIPLPNPIPLNSRGEISNAAGVSCQLFLTAGVAYTFTLYDVYGNQLNQSTFVTSGQNNTPFLFTTTSCNATANATYTNNGFTYTVAYTVAGSTTLQMIGTGGSPLASGTLTKTSGTGDATITYSAVAISYIYTGNVIGNVTGNVTGDVTGHINGNTITTGSSTFTGYAGQTYTFPSTTASIARTDAAQSFTGNQTISGFIKTSAVTGGIGYTSGASGGFVIQLTSKTTGVTTTGMTGQVITSNSALAGGAVAQFLMTNTNLAVGDILLVSQSSQYGAGTVGAYRIKSETYTGSAYIYITNETGGSLSEAVNIQFCIIKTS